MHPAFVFTFITFPIYVLWAEKMLKQLTSNVQHLPASFVLEAKCCSLVLPMSSGI